MPRPGRPYGTKNQHRLASEMKISVEKSRAILMDTTLAKRTAKARTTRALREGWQGRAPDYEGGNALKEGLKAMADRADLGDQLYAKVEAMDQDVLAEMYSQNKLTFEVAFNYEGIRRNEQGEYEVYDAGRKRGDFEFMIGEYNRYAAATGRPTV